MLIDTHAHLETVDDLDDVLERAKSAGVSKIITIGTSLATSKTAANLAISCLMPGLDLFASAGIHPSDGKEDFDKFGIDKCMEELRKIIKESDKVVGIGEAGLDYHPSPRLRNGKLMQKTLDDEKTYQRDLFKAQIKLASELNLPLVVHCRNGWSEVLQIISKFQDPSSKLGGVFHSFTGGIEEAKKAVELGFYVSFSGIVTFKQGLRSSQAAGLKSAQNIREAAKIVPKDKILVETDSPYLAPEPIRGQTNESANVRITAAFLSNLLGLKEDSFFKQTSENAQKLFDI